MLYNDNVKDYVEYKTVNISKGRPEWNIQKMGNLVLPSINFVSGGHVLEVLLY